MICVLYCAALILWREVSNGWVTIVGFRLDNSARAKWAVLAASGATLAVSREVTLHGRHNDQFYSQRRCMDKVTPQHRHQTLKAAPLLIRDAGMFPTWMTLNSPLMTVIYPYLDLKSPQVYLNLKPRLDSDHSYAPWHYLLAVNKGIWVSLIIRIHVSYKPYWVYWKINLTTQEGGGQRMINL